MGIVMMIIADEHYQPYFKAFVLHHELQIGDSFVAHEYIIWIQGKWREWRRMKGFPENHPPILEHRRLMAEWLFDTAPAGQIEWNFGE
jgi:hypothetical protein